MACSEQTYQLASCHAFARILIGSVFRTFFAADAVERSSKKKETLRLEASFTKINEVRKTRFSQNMFFQIAFTAAGEPIIFAAPFFFLSRCLTGPVTVAGST